MASFKVTRVRIKAARASSSNKRAGLTSSGEIVVNAPHSNRGHKTHKARRHKAG